MKRLLGDIRRADEDFHMIARGDRVAVGVSGGKDSLMLLRALAVYSRFAVKPFEVVAITLKTGDPFDVAPIRALCEELNVPYVVEECDLIHQLFDVRREENPCALCARVRRGALLRMAGEGMPYPGRKQRGDMLVEVKVLTPTRLSARQEELLREFEAAGEQTPLQKVKKAAKKIGKAMGLD